MSDEIDKLIGTRRAAVGRARDDSGTWGLALSGGGIRSATFCFGLLTALSRNRLLGRFDLLSTVSGGGYIGAMLGRLLGRATSAAEACRVMDGLGVAGEPYFRWWLRANGRYLAPKGAADRLFAATMYLRNLLAVHLEFGAMALLLGAVLGAVDVLAWSAVSWYAGVAGHGPDAAAGAGASPWFDVLRGLSELLPTPWLLLLGFLPFMALLSCAYWVLPWVARGRRLWLLWGLSGAAVALLGVWHGLWFDLSAPGASTRVGLAALVFMLVVGWLVAIPWAAWLLRARGQGPGRPLRDDEEAVRRRLTDRLVCWVKVACVVLIAGLVDRVAWLLAFQYRDLVSVGVWLAVVAAVLRALMPAVASLNPRSGGTRGLLMLGQLGGYLLVFLLCAWWVSIVQRAALGAMFGGAPTVDFAAPLPILALIGGGAAAYLLLTGRNFEFLNLSSLHTFYRARLVRSYLGAANPGRFDQPAPLGATGIVPDGAGPRLKTVYSPDPDDDVAMTGYAPHLWGGPVHLINVCLNQTHDPRGGLFNQDRRGQALTVAPGGLLRVGRDAWRRFGEDAALTLGAWTAISGAAVAPGLGAGTRGGVSALLAFAGVRLGYWWTAEQRGGQAPAWWRTAKSRGLLREVFASFKADDCDDWFLSDGGHFENTGVHALLAEEAAFMVVADCGADPEYRFGDLENLVRKARIDFGAELRFLRPRVDAALPAPPEAMRAFGALGDLSATDSSACLALARVAYASGRQGLLVVVKPNLCDGLPVDLLNFAAANPEFPQQTTADQFFDEAQWESYFQLGQSLGRGLTPDFMDWLQARAADFFEVDSGAVGAHAAAPDSEPAASAPARRLPERLRANAVTATVGLGGVLSVGLPLWTEVQKALGTEEARRAAEAQVLDEMAKAWAELPPEGCDPLKAAAGAVSKIDALAEVVRRNSDTLCAGEGAGRRRWSLPARQIFWDAEELCGLLPVASQPRSCVRLLELVSVLRVAGRADDCLLRAVQRDVEDSRPLYWGYAYAIDVTRAPDPDRAQAHPADPDVARVRSHKYEADQARQRMCAPAASAVSVEPAPGPQGPLEPPPAVPVKPAPLVCAGKTVYMQIYGGGMRDEVRDYREPWRRLGASVPPIEDVYATADSKRRQRPAAVGETTVRYHDETSKACADALAAAARPDKQAVWKVERLAPSLRPTPGVIEVWVANPKPAAP